MPNDETWTWDQLAQVAAQVTEEARVPGRVRIRRIRHWRRGTGRGPGNTVRKSGPPRVLAVSQATITSFFDYANKLVAMKAGRQQENVTAVLDQSLFATNKAAFHLLFHTQISAFGTASGTEMKLLRLPAQATGESPWSTRHPCTGRCHHAQPGRGQCQTDRLLLTDPAATKVLTTERHSGDPQQGGAPLLDPQAKVALDFTQSISPELVPPPQVTPPNASGFSAEFTPWAPRCSSVGRPAGGRRYQGARDHPEHAVVSGDRAVTPG